MGIALTEGINKMEETDGTSSSSRQEGVDFAFLGLATMATQKWAEGAWIGEWHTEQKEAWMRQIFEVQTWRQARGPAGAVMCETRDLGILIFEGQVAVDMRYVCPKDVKKMLLKQARSTYWKKWAAKHEYEELKECIWL